MILGRAALSVLLWMHVIVVPIILWILSDGFTEKLRLETWLFFGAVVLVELAWMGFHRWGQRFEHFTRKYPGYRMKD